MLTESEIKELKEELSLQSEFQAAISASQSRQAQGLISSPKDILLRWCSLLNQTGRDPGESKGFCAFVLCCIPGADPELLVDEDGSASSALIAEVLSSGIGPQVREAARLGKQTRWYPMLGRDAKRHLVITSPVMSSGMRASLIAITPSAKTGHIQSILLTASLLAEREIAHFEAGKVAERTRALMAERLTQACSTSILVAQFRLEGLQSGFDPGSEAGKEIEGIRQDLEDAQLGFDRARLLARDSTGGPRIRLRISKLLSDVLESLPRVRVAPSIEVDLAAGAEEERLMPSASRPILWYAFRDITLITWLLSEKSRVVIGVSTLPGSIAIEWRGGEVGESVNLTREVAVRFPDLEFRIAADDEYRIERNIGLALAAASIDSLGGRLEIAVTDDRRIRIAVTLPAEQMKETR